jgi:hypothetical protein
LVLGDVGATYAGFGAVCLEFPMARENAPSFFSLISLVISLAFAFKSMKSECRDTRADLI